MNAAGRHNGFTLLEVMLATGLLLGPARSCWPNWPSIGRQHANAAEDLSTAQRLLPESAQRNSRRRRTA